MHHGDDVKVISDFYEGKRVLITGHTGFKGSWLCRILKILKSDIYGYSLEPPSDPNLYNILESDRYVTSMFGDIGDYSKLSNFYQKCKPDIVFHLAAQPLVKVGYNNPVYTYMTNVMGTVNILECVRQYGAKSVLNVTTDKVYDNIEDYSHEYSENERLDGYDPYSNSKSCSELITHCYARSFFQDKCPISTARAGNVIGGGDFAPDRIVPDCVYAATHNKEIILRNPNSIRPYQHVLEPLYVYLIIAMEQYLDHNYSGNYNVGPGKEDCITTGKLAELFCKQWPGELEWYFLNDGGPHEAKYLSLNSSKIKETFGISPQWHIEEAVSKTVEWTKTWASGGDVGNCTDNQIRLYLKGRGIDV